MFSALAGTFSNKSFGCAPSKNHPFEYDTLGRIAESTRDEGETLASCLVTMLCYGNQELIRKQEEHLITSVEM